MPLQHLKFHLNSCLDKKGLHRVSPIIKLIPMNWIF
jgi:hypothetical protein